MIIDNGVYLKFCNKFLKIKPLLFSDYTITAPHVGNKSSSFSKFSANSLTDFIGPLLLSNLQ